MMSGSMSSEREASGAPALAQPWPMSISGSDGGVTGPLVKSADQSSEGRLMCRRKYSGYKTLLDKLQR